MLTAEERQELAKLRARWNLLPSMSTLPRLIALERKDAADPTPIVDCCSRPATECNCPTEKRTAVWQEWFKRVNPQSILPGEHAPDLDNHLLAKPKPKPAEVWVRAQGSPGNWTVECSKCHQQRPVCCDDGAGLHNNVTPEHKDPTCAKCCNHPATWTGR